jgi:hypothetical protein
VLVQVHKHVRVRFRALVRVGDERVLRACERVLLAFGRAYLALEVKEC